MTSSASTTPRSASRLGAASVDDVREIVSGIPPRRVVTYGDIGAALGIGARQAGRLMGILNGQDIPWWRVVYADGTPATCHADTATDILCAEGTPMRGARVDLARARHRIG